MGSLSLKVKAVKLCSLGLMPAVKHCMIMPDSFAALLDQLLSTFLAGAEHKDETSKDTLDSF